MRFSLPLFPEQASAVAGQVDALYFFLIGVSVFFSLLIAGLVIYFAIKYRRKADSDPMPKAATGGVALEIAWSVIPLGISMVIFFWGASIFFTINRPPDDALEIYVVAKQWMWKLQHMEGQREINELHIPLGRAVRLRMTSEDVIHSFYVPVFRVKQDVLPGRYTQLWFHPTKPGKYHLFCAEYCGTKHSGMIGWVYVMEPADYQAWLSGGRAKGRSLPAASSCFRAWLAPIATNRTAADGVRCSRICSERRSTSKAGGKVVVDEAYLRESILTPQAKLAKGFQPIMPTFQGLVTEDQLLQLIEYIKSKAKKK